MKRQRKAPRPGLTLGRALALLAVAATCKWETSAGLTTAQRVVFNC
jgi:hypothetical protein